MYETGLRIRNNSAYAVATAGNAASIELWCNEHCDMLHVNGEADSDVLDRIRDTVGVAAPVERGDELVVVTAGCLRDREINYIESCVRKHDLSLVPLLRYRGGAKVHRLLAVPADDLTTCFRDLVGSGFDVSVESKRVMSFTSRSGPLLAPADAMPALAGRQRETLRLAHAGGYYNLPYGIETTTIADEMGVSWRIAEEHLHRAERKVMDSVIQYAL